MENSKYVCSNCGSEDVDLCCDVNPNTMQIMRILSDYEEGYCCNCEKKVILKKTKTK